MRQSLNKLWTNNPFKSAVFAAVAVVNAKAPFYLFILFNRFHHDYNAKKD